MTTSAHSQAATPTGAQGSIPDTAGGQPVAQESTPAPAALEAHEANADIIVTAQRRSESVMKVPVSVTVIGADALANNGINDLTAVTKLAPSLQVGADNQFSVRGVGTATFANTVEASVSQVIDDVVLGNRNFASNGFYDVERVEVLNGPQGLLFGKNASAGLVNITTKMPVLNKTSLSFDTEATSRYRTGSDGLGIRLRSTANLPIGENSALRLNALYSYQDAINHVRSTSGVRADANVENYSVRAKFLTQPVSNLSIYVIGDYSKSSGISGLFDYTFRSIGAGSQYTAILPANGVTPGNRNFDSVVDAPFYRDLETGGLQAKATYTLDNEMEISNIAAWKASKNDQQFDSDFTPVNYLNFNGGISRYKQFSNEFRVALPSGNAFGGQFGVYYYYSKDDASGTRNGNNGFPAVVAQGFPFCVGATVAAGPPPACSVSNVAFLGQDYASRNTSESIAAFGQFSYALTDTLKLTAGGRFTHDRVGLDLVENVNPYFVTLGVINNRYSGVVKNDNFSWKLGADWELTPQTLIYGFYGHGYKGPGFSNAAPARNADLSVQPELSKGGEIGVKQSFLDHRVNVSLSAFYTTFNDLQVQAFDAVLRTVVLGNAGKATTKGIDFTVQARPVTGLTLGFSGSILDAKYDRYPGRQCYPGQADASCAVNGTFDASGRRIPLSAKFTSTVNAEYNYPLSDDLGVLVGGSYYHRSQVLSDYAPGTVIPKWDTIDTNIGLTGNGWKASLFCKNCFNAIRPLSVETEAGDGINLNVLSYVQRRSYDSVRTIGLRFGFDL